MIVLLLLVLSSAGLSLAIQTTAPAQQDSYVNAYTELHQTTTKNDRDYHSSGQGVDFTSHGYTQGPVYRPEGSYPPSASQQQYGPPKPEYGPPQKFEYGPPKPEYGPPHFEYGPPKPIYGPPKPIYGPPSTG